jgi:hypothetical protein
MSLAYYSLMQQICNYGTGREEQWEKEGEMKSEGIVGESEKERERNLNRNSSSENLRPLALEIRFHMRQIFGVEKRAKRFFHYLDGKNKYERKGKERKGKERKGKERKGKERKGKERKGKRKGKERKGKERKGKERKGKERKGKERKVKEEKGWENEMSEKRE